jgi:hypothetical protein
MYCVHCATQLDESARFCSACGRDQSVSPPPLRKQRDWDLHVSLLAWLFIAQAALTAIIGVVIIFVGAVVGRAFARTPSLMPPDIPPEAAPFIGTVGVLIGFFLIALALPSIAAGIGLLHYRNWGRVLTLILSFIKILEVPLGTLTAIYAFWVLLSQGGSDFYRKKAVEPEG